MNRLPDIFDNYTVRFVVEGSQTTSHATLEDALRMKNHLPTADYARIRVEISYYLDTTTQSNLPPRDSKGRFVKKHS